MTQSQIISASNAPSARPTKSGRWPVCTGAVILLLLPCGFGVTWFSGLRDRFVPLNFGVVEPGRLYRSGQISRQVIRKTLEQNHIGLIIDLSSEWENTADARAERQTAAELGIQRVNFTLLGNGLGNPAIYPAVLADIQQANRRGQAVLVHCQSGSQRTGGIVASYRILIERQSHADAFAEMQSYGHNRARNPNLIPFLESNLPTWKTHLAEIPAANKP